MTDKYKLDKPLNEADFTAEEMEKCKASPLYFFNTYVRKPEQPELTQEEYDAYVERVDKIVYSAPMRVPLHLRQQPQLPKDCYEKLPDFLKPTP